MGDFKAGVAEVNITPPVGISLCGFGARKGPSEAVHDDLFARALVLDDGQMRLAMVTADVISFAPDLVDRIRDLVAKGTGIPGAQVMLNGSHSHSGPTVMSFRAMGHRDAAYEDVLCRAVAGAAKMAVDGLRPARLSHGRAPVRIGHNRREKRDGRMVLGHNPGGAEAPWVDVLRIDGEHGAPFGLLYCTASHPVNLTGLSFGAEFPGYAAKFVRRHWPGVAPMFAQGCCGDINCAPKDGAFATSERLGTLLGAAALTAAMQTEPVEGASLAALCRKVDLPLMVPVVDEAKKALSEAQANLARARGDKSITPYLFQQAYEGMVGWATDYLKAARAGGHPVQPFEIQIFRIGEVAVVGYPGEMFVDYQLTLDAQSPFVRTFALGYTNGCIGYVPTAAAYPDGGYEVDRAFRYYGTLMISSDCEALIKTATFEMLKALK